MTFEVPDMTGWSDTDRAEFYEANVEHIDEIFDDGTVQFYADPDTTLTTRVVPMTIREAQIFDNKQKYHAQQHRSAEN